MNIAGIIGVRSLKLALPFSFTSYVKIKDLTLLLVRYHWSSFLSIYGRRQIAFLFDLERRI